MDFTRKTMSDQTTKTAKLNWVGAEGLSFTEDSPIIDLEMPQKLERTLYKKKCEWCGEEFETYLITRQKYCKNPQCIKERKRNYEMEWVADHRGARKRYKKKSREKIKWEKEIKEHPERIDEKDRKAKSKRDKIRLARELEDQWNRHGHEWGKIKAEKTLAKVPPIKVTL